MSDMARPLTAGPDAIGLGEMVSRYTLKALNNEGYINCNIAPYDPNFSRGAIGVQLRLAERQEILKANPDETQYGAGELRQGEPAHIHPILQRTQWNNLDDRDWLAILPSVELASRFLDEPAIAPFFNGLIKDGNVTRLDDPIHEAAHGREFERWDYDNSILGDDASMTKALFSMMGYRDFVRLRFKDTNGTHGLSGWIPKYSHCIININQEYLFVLRGDTGWGAQRWSQPWVPGTNEESARLRTRVLLAITIIHELTHCTWNIRNRGERRPEPYLRDRPINELGRELENMIFLGIIEPSGEDPTHVSTPYGTNIERYPSLLYKEEKKLRKHLRGKNLKD